MKQSVQTFRDKFLFGPGSHVLRAMPSAQGRLAAFLPYRSFFSTQFPAPCSAGRGIGYSCLLGGGGGVLLSGPTGLLCPTVVCLRIWVPRMGTTSGILISKEANQINLPWPLRWSYLNVHLLRHLLKQLVNKYGGDSFSLSFPS